ncbi:MAG: monothiol glutaredoxin, Grx4 family [Alphaproteobacteria bacterium]|nr:MAG: monothiol glutaredoxin, Grx4 family [Alphaproteobacteria bacterium]
MENIIFERIKTDLNANEIVLYMKGTPIFPQCGFSAAIAQIMGVLGVQYHSVDVLQDSEIRQGIKDFTNWPTIPQLYVKGEFVGGCDIIREMYEAGELQQLFRDNKITFSDAA